MKKIISAFLAISLLLTLLVITGCADESSKADKEIVLNINNPVMTVNGEEKAIDENGTVPVIKNGRTLLPIRAVDINSSIKSGSLSFNSANSSEIISK